MVPQQQQYVKSEVKNEVHDGSQNVQVVKQQPNTQIIQAPAHLVSAHRVAEILKAAGETFCRLGECTMMLDQTAQPSKTKVSKCELNRLLYSITFQLYAIQFNLNTNFSGMIVMWANWPKLFKGSRMIWVVSRQQCNRERVKNCAINSKNKHKRVGCDRGKVVAVKWTVK